MVDYATAQRTRDHFQDQLFLTHPEIVSLAPQRKRDAQGQPTQEAFIFVGVRKLPDGGAGVTPIPKQLPAIDQQDQVIPNLMVDLVIEETGPIYIGDGPPHIELLRRVSTPGRVRPSPGGYAISHLADGSGTLGGIAKQNGSWAYVLSCNHVLTGSNSFALGDEIYQPAPGAGNLIANLDRWVPIEYRTLTTVPHNEADAALARVIAPWRSYVDRAIAAIGVPASIADPVLDQRVRLNGMTSGVQEGKVEAPDTSCRGIYPNKKEAVFVHAFSCAKRAGGPMTTGGDSGALIWDLSSFTVLGLHFCKDDNFSYGIPIRRVLELLSQATTAVDSLGNPVMFPSAKIELF